VRLGNILVKAGSGATGIPAIDRFIKNRHPAFVARDRQIFLTDELARRTSVSDPIVLGALLTKSGAPNLFAKGTASLSSRIARLRDLADELSDKLADAERTALGVLVLEPNDKSLSEWLAKRGLAKDAEEAATELLCATERAESELALTTEYASATVTALEKLAAISRKDEHYLGVNVALRCAALSHFVQKTHREAIHLAGELLSGRRAEPLPPHLIPSEWVDRGAPPDFVWDEMALVPS
jgi:hypothetical protein